MDIDLNDITGAESLKDLVREAFEEAVRDEIKKAVAHYFKVNGLVVRDRIRRELDKSEIDG